MSMSDDDWKTAAQLGDEAEHRDRMASDPAYKEQYLKSISGAV